MSESLKPFVDRLKQRVSIVEIVGRSVPLQPKGKNFWGCCPFHNEKTPSFSVNEELGIYKCFGCGEGGDVITFMMKKHGLQYMDALRELAAIAGMKLPELRPRDPAEEDREREYFTILGEAAKMYAAELGGSIADEYLRGRDLGAEIIAKYGLGYAPKNNIISGRFGEKGVAAGLVRHSTYGGSDYDFFRGRLMFPIMDVRGNVIAFSGRSLDGSEPKYMNIAETEFFAKRRTLYGLNFALSDIRQKRRAIIVEGQIDAIQMQMRGFGETVAPLGTALTAEHVHILLKYAKELVFCFDGDAAGQKAAARASSLVLPELKADMTIRFAFMSGGKDPDELLRSGVAGGSAMAAIIDSAKLLPDFVWDLANRNFSVRTESGRVRADRWIRSEYEKVPDAGLKNEFLTTLRSREWDAWKRFRREIVPEMKAPDPSGQQIRIIAEIAAKFPDIYERNFELLGTVTSGAADTGMSRQTAEKHVAAIALKKQLENLVAEHASAVEIQRVKDAMLELWTTPVIVAA
ncbi:MAG: DNA primase [Rickettsiales bacterium]|jgi:DNA primase|nr:DNA primase [Rickettsiales bacterium]